MEQPLIAFFEIIRKSRPKSLAVGVAVRREPPRGKQRNPAAFSCLFSYAAFFCGIRRNSSKATANLCRTFIFTAEKKKGRTRRLQRRISPLCGSVGCLLGYPLALRTGRFLRLFRQREELAVLFLYSAVIYTQVGLVLWV